MTGIAKNTIVKLLVDLGAACSAFQDAAVRGLLSKRVQCDEIWSFVYAKKKTMQKDQRILDRNADAGDIWTWTAIDADSKLWLSFLVGARIAESAFRLMSDVRARIQLTTDQLSIFLRTTLRRSSEGIRCHWRQPKRAVRGDLTASRPTPDSSCSGCL